MEEKRNEVMQEMVGVQEEAYKSGSVQYIDSRKVAEIIEKQHKNLIRDIKQYCKELVELKIEPVNSNQLKIEPVDFFIESVYVDAKGERRPCYLVTKKGCEFIAHKLTGIKGTKFTATYINLFHEMEDALEMKTTPIAIQQFMENQQNLMQKLMEMNRSVSDRLDALESRKEEPIRFTVGPGSKPFMVTVDENASRKKKLNRLVSKMAKACGWTRSFTLHRLYKTLEEVLDINIDDYEELYKEEIQGDACAIDAVVAFDNLYTMAIKLCNNTLSQMNVEA